MALLVVSIFDKVAESFGRPFFVPAKGLAIRSFVDEINRAGQDNGFYMHPDDYTLFWIGEFDDGSGELLPRTPEALMTGSAAKVRE